MEEIRNLESLAYEAVIPIDEIDTSNRRRKKFNEDKVGELAAAIELTGLTNPVTVRISPNGGYKLMAGETRIRCHRLLKKDEIRARIYPVDTTDIEALTIEIDENIKRANFTWQEEVDALQELRDMMRRAGMLRGENKALAEKLNISTAKVSNDLQLAEAIKTDPDLAKIGSKKDALKALGKKREEAIKAELSKRVDKKESMQSKEIREKGIISRFIQGDCIAGMKKLRPATVDCIELDPPYGINYDTMVDALTPNASHYADTPDYGKLMKAVLAEAYRILKDDRWIVCWCSITRLEETIKLIEGAKFNCRRAPIIWDKDSQGRCMSPDISLTVDYEVCLYASKGDAKLNHQGATSVIRGKGKKTSDHPNEKPVAIIQTVLDKFCIPKDVVCSPFLGSGNVIFACQNLSLEGFGFDLEEKYRNDFIARVQHKETVQSLVDL